MVYFDINDTLKPQHSAQNEKHYAGPFVRFFSALIDYCIFFPIVAFFMTLFLKDAISMIGTSATSTHFGSILFQVLVFYILLFTFFQAACIYFNGATPGQSFLKVFVSFEHQHSSFFFQIWFRQIGFVLSLFCLGMPFLALFYHDKRRTFYDRLSECDVLTLAPSENFSLQELDKKYLTAGLSVIMGFFTAVLFVSMIQSHYHSMDNMRVLSKRSLLNKKCFDIENQTQEDRLKTALVLNVMKTLPDECLVLEADIAFDEADKQLDTLAYFAKYYVQENKDDKAKYLNLACGGKIKSELCPKMSRGIASVTEIKEKKSDIAARIVKKLSQSMKTAR